MGLSPRANIAYGYALGSDNRLDVRERVGDYGTDLTVDWWRRNGDETHDSDDDTDVTTQIYRRLYDAIPGAAAGDEPWDRYQPVADHFGVKLSYTGAEWSSGYVLIAVGSEQKVEWDEVMTLDVERLAHMPHEDNQWDSKLARALQVLGITPIQDGPRWLVFPSYG